MTLVHTIIFNKKNKYILINNTLSICDFEWSLHTKSTVIWAYPKFFSVERFLSVRYPMKQSRNHWFFFIWEMYWRSTVWIFTLISTHDYQISANTCLHACVPLHTSLIFKRIEVHRLKLPNTYRKCRMGIIKTISFQNIITMTDAYFKWVIIISDKVRLCLYEFAHEPDVWKEPRYS